MSTIELKKTLIQRIVEINDVSFLKAIKTILDIRSNDEVIKLTPVMRKEINASKKEIENGLFITDEKLEKEIEAWLKEK
jgi:predicted transcriptional regulator